MSRKSGKAENSLSAVTLNVRPKGSDKIGVLEELTPMKLTNKALRGAVRLDSEL